MLCEIRAQITQEYVTKHETGKWKRKAGEITQKDYETYAMPGTAILQCHKSFTNRVMPLLQMSYDAVVEHTHIVLFLNAKDKIHCTAAMDWHQRLP